MITVKRKTIQTKTGGTNLVLDVRFLGILVYRKYLHSEVGRV